jgi:photosystem II stability/assembly factor-like uncharacterized protein
LFPKKQIFLPVLKKIYLPLLYALILLFCCISCKKKQTLSLNYSTLTVYPGLKINNTFWANNLIGYACGGEKSAFGKIYKTINGGQNWNEIYSTTNLSLYDINFINDTIGYCCGENFKMYYTLNAGQTWINYKFAWMPGNYQNATLRNLATANDRVVVVGGDNFNVGISFQFAYNFFNYKYSHPDSELRNSMSFDNNQSHYLFGYGYTFKSLDTLKTYFPINLTNDFFTGCCAVNNSVGYACGYDAGIYKTTNAGVSWKKIKDVNRIIKSRSHFNCILFTDELNGWCAGSDGLILRTTNGKDWKKIEYSGEENFLSIRKKNGSTVVISTSVGTLLEFN